MPDNAQIGQYVASGSDISNGGVPFVDADGYTYVYLYVASACTAKTPYCWYTVDTSYRPLQTAMAAASAICTVVVATETKSAAGWSKFQLTGKVSSMICPSITYVQLQTLKIASSLVAAGGAVTVTPDDFAIVLSTGTTATTVDVYLLGREITPT